MNDAPLPPAGWYPDPEGGTGTRYWNGTSWTAHAQEAAAEVPPAPSYPAAYGTPVPSAPTSGYPAYGMQQPAGKATGFWVGGLVCGLVATLFCPILLGPAGIALGAVAVKKGDKLGWVAVGVSIVCMLVGFALGAAAFMDMQDSSQL